MSRVRAFVLVVNNPTDTVEDALSAMHLNVADLRYFCGQYERGSNGTLHFQCYLQFGCALRITQVQERLQSQGIRGAVQVAKGSLEQNRHYCSKPHDSCRCDHCNAARQLPNNGRSMEPGHGFIEEGEAQSQGKRNDFKEIMELIKGGASELEIAESFPGTWMRYYRACERFRALAKPIERNWITHTTVLWGPPGTGKTHRAHELAGAGAYWVTYGTTTGAPQYFDGYDGQEVVVFDEFFGQIRLSEMCKLLDRYPCNVPTRGGQQPWLPKRVIITSNSPPEQWWPRVGLGAMARRLTGDYGEVIEMRDVYQDGANAGVGADAPEQEERGVSPTIPYNGAIASGFRVMTCGECKERIEFCTCNALSTIIGRREADRGVRLRGPSPDPFGSPL